MKFANLAAGLFTAILIIACSSTERETPLTVWQYAVIVCDLVEPPDEYRLPTWGELTDAIRQALPRLRRVVPPEPVREHHRVLMEFWEAVREFTASKPPNASYDPNVTWIDPQIAAVANRLRATREGLASDRSNTFDHSYTLRRHGCL